MNSPLLPYSHTLLRYAYIVPTLCLYSASVVPFLMPIVFRLCNLTRLIRIKPDIMNVNLSHLLFFLFFLTSSSSSSSSISFLLDCFAYVSIESTYRRSHPDRAPSPTRTAHTPRQAGGHLTVHPATRIAHTLQVPLHCILVITVSYGALHCNFIEMKAFSSLSVDHNSFFSSFHAIPILTHIRMHARTQTH